MVQHVSQLAKVHRRQGNDHSRMLPEAGDDLLGLVEKLVDHLLAPRLPAALQLVGGDGVDGDCVLSGGSHARRVVRGDIDQEAILALVVLAAPGARHPLLDVVGAVVVVQGNVLVGAGIHVHAQVHHEHRLHQRHIVHRRCEVGGERLPPNEIEEALSGTAAHQH